jgi:hypothetical protein
VTEVVEKYKKFNNSQEKWYDRGLAELLNYSDADCSFDYIFCNDKDRQLIDPSELIRVTNPIPREAQGLIQIKDALGFYNYKSGTCPVDKTETNKMKITATCDTIDACQTEFATVTVRAIIHEGGFGGPGMNGFVFRLGGDTENAPDDPADTAYFGNTEPGDGGTFPLHVTNGNQFKGATRNFIAYIEGTDYWGEMEQWKSTARFLSKSKFGVVSKYEAKDTRENWYGQITQGTNGIFFYQEYKFKVIKGTRGFIRLASHKMETGSGDAQNTSTYVIGVLNDLRQYEGESDITSLIDISTKEIYFDTAAGDFDTFKTIVISDNVRGATAEPIPSYSGYIKDKNGFPVEGARINVSPSGGSVSPIITDHNGFYHFNKNDASVTGTILGELDCDSWENLYNLELLGFPGIHTEHDIIIENTTYANSFYAKVQASVRDCDGNGVPGVRLSISGSKYRITDGTGTATFRVRNYQNRNRQVRVVVMNSAGCITKDCANNCNPAMPTNIYVLSPCFNTTPTVNAGPFIVNTDFFLDKRGLKSGGRYAFGVVAKGNCGKHSAVYHTQYLEIPKTQEKGGLGFCTLAYNAAGSVYPDWVNCLQIVRSKNENGFELQWVVDKIERVGGKIKLTIQTLNDYNQSFFYQSNTIYQWKKGDRIEFVRNGDGKVFTTTVHGILNYLAISPFHDTLISGQTSTNADFFNQLLIEDDDRLASLTEGAIIEIQRPKEIITETIYYEICASLEVVDGALVHPTGTFETFDTFIVNRTSGSFLGFFEHHSPSDFWGSRVSDTGRGYVANRYENERRFGRNISISSVGVPNRFGDLVKTFDAPEQGDITAMFISDGKIILAIGEHDSFLAQSSNDLLRVGGDGIIRAASPDQIISDAEPKIRGQFGCQYPHIGSIFFGDGYVTWADVNKKAYVKHDYNMAVDISEGKMQSFLRRKYLEMTHVNSGATDFLNHMRFATGFNMMTKAVFVTIKSLRHAAINNEDDPYTLPNVTFSVFPDANEFGTFYSFTPEGYGYVNLSTEEGCSFMTYQNGIPYYHPVLADKWLEFFGTACDWKVGVAINQHPNKNKIPQAMEIKADQMWFAKDVRISRDGFKSEIPPVRVKRSNGKWNAAFLRNINSRGGLYNGNEARDSYITVLLCRDNTYALKYNTTDDAKRTQYGELDALLFKFSLSEQSGFDQNL